MYKRKDAPRYTGPIVEFYGVTTLYSENAKIKIKLEAPVQYVQSNDDVLYPEGLKIGMYNTAGIKTTELQADSGRYDHAQQLYTAIGRVSVMNLEQAQTLYTPRINWSQMRREIFTDDSIKIVTPNEVLRGIGLVSNEEFSRYIIKKPTGIFSIKPETAAATAK